MKKIITLLLIVVAAMTPNKASAQVQFGLKGGLNVTNMSLSSDVLDVENRTGFFIGPTVKFKLPLVGLGFDASLLYDQREGKLKDDNSEATTLKQQSLQIPVNVRYSFGLSSLASLYLFAGPQFGINVGDKEKNSYKLKDTNFSVNVGLGLLLLSHLQVSANYNIACGKTADIDVAGVAQKVTGTALGNAKNNAWQIALAYYF